MSLRGQLRRDFLREVCQLLVQSSGADMVEIRLQAGDRCYRAGQSGEDPPHYTYETTDSLSVASQDPPGMFVSALGILSDSVLSGKTQTFGNRVTGSNSIWIGLAEDIWPAATQSAGVDLRTPAPENIAYESVALMPFSIAASDRGVLVLASQRAHYFNRSSVEFYEGIAQVIGVASIHRRAQLALRERVKELTCLYRIAQLAGQPGTTLFEFLGATVNVLPPGWLFPEIASALISLDGTVYTSDDHRRGVDHLRADIVLNQIVRGWVEVSYAESRPPLSEGPFLREERNLINAIAEEVALIVDRFESRQRREVLEDQLRHADRLATIGQLAAGVAHELNEPLESILGFAQLASKSHDLPTQVQSDLRKITTASLHAREVTRKLLLFARDTPFERGMVSLNKVVADGLYFLEARCAKAGIELCRELDPAIPDITADSGQLHQILVNLVANAVHATPAGGHVTVRTRSADDCVILQVVDTGVGMDKDVLQKVFDPFFTTKDVDEGTGLGLAVVHGIVTAHGGTISVKSEPSKGARFEVRLPLIATINPVQDRRNDDVSRQGLDTGRR